MSTPSTAAISSALFTASADSNCTISMVASLMAALASATGTARYSRWGRTPPAPRSPSGANFAALTTARASSAEADARCDDAERAAIQHALGVFGRVGGNADHVRNAGADRPLADLAAGLAPNGPLVQGVELHVHTPRARPLPLPP